MQARIKKYDIFCAARNYMFNINNRNTKTRCEICLK